MYVLYQIVLVVLAPCDALRASKFEKTESTLGRVACKGTCNH